LTEISAPTLLMCGGEDIITPPRHAEEMGRRLRDAEVHIIPQTLQGVLTEKPESFELVLDFLARH
jgi:pimeloyl-ACP methyl ester carboxylesterase